MDSDPTSVLGSFFKWRKEGGGRGWESRLPLSLQHFIVGTYHLAGHHHTLGRARVGISMSVFQWRRQKLQRALLPLSLMPSVKETGMGIRIGG